ncbi:MAG TPA: glycosyltransferase family 39 protein, partial [Candidatus Goldiibacteriota bacterium]|nr:glycosyltransferase family 39 protein [Candidatus Goldiibacteriota bacterium]
MAAHFPELEGRNYIPYMPDDQVNWSTFVFYLGLFFTKLFGYNIGSVRIPSAIFALLSVLAFYFLLRRITSPVTAALITPLFMANECFISLSRQFYPVTVLFLAPLLGAYFIIEGLHKNKWYYFLLSGLAVGYSLHGYLSGRPIVLTFIIWLFVLFIIYKNKNILKYSAVFLAGFAITALPVIWTSIVKPDVAWHYVHFTDPRKGADIFGRIDQFLDAIIPHLRLFYTGGDVESLLKPAGD